MEIPIIESICGLGVGAVLGVVIFMMYRKDRNSTEQRIADICAGHESRLREDRNQIITLITKDQETREKHTDALKELTTTLKRMNGRKN